ncbi:hypothetical protein [Halobellus ordinarius]|uniref:hypothetical protein n=1 Tax=Halobellus ordinarius TaxID=3075120 RepID=UPI0028802377|nr:hypothetical protein [Halobellus sp. ZY16]
MAHAMDGDAEHEEVLYHVVCHDCETEFLSHGEREAEERLSEHQSSTGHNVEYAALSETGGN